MTYEQIISWIETRYNESNYTFGNEDDLSKIRQQLIKDYDSDGRLNHFINGNPHFTRYMNGRKWNGIEGTSVEANLFDNVEKPLIDTYNNTIFDDVSSEIGSVSDFDDLRNVKIPTDLMRDTIQRLKDLKGERETELVETEIRSRLEDTSLDFSEFSQISRLINKVPDNSTKRGLNSELNREKSRLLTLKNSFVTRIRSARAEGILEDVINDAESSDLRSDQLDAIRDLIDAKKGAIQENLFEEETEE